jgi:sugar fermentation stimulation protein A
MQLFRIPDALECKITKRINRFVVEIKVEGGSERAYINNTGRLRELLFKGNRGYCIEHNKEKTKFRLFSAKADGGFALIDTAFQMRAFEQSAVNGFLPWLKCSEFKRNAKVGISVIDYIFSGNFYLELKSAALKVGEYAMYPDCPSEREKTYQDTD